jgi:hypothetical protein
MIYRMKVGFVSGNILNIGAVQDMVYIKMAEEMPRTDLYRLRIAAVITETISKAGNCMVTKRDDITKQCA